MSESRHFSDTATGIRNPDAAPETLAIPDATGSTNRRSTAHDRTVSDPDWRSTGGRLPNIEWRIDSDGRVRFRASVSIASKRRRGPWTLNRREALDLRDEWLATRPDAQIPTETEAPEGREGTVYFVQVETDGPIKIGFTQGDPLVRLAALQGACPLPLRLIGTNRGGEWWERALHEHFAGARIRGEWFEATPELLAIAAGRVW